MSLRNWLAALTEPGRLGSMSVRSRILADPYYRFQSAAELAIAASLGIHIDANQASVDDWLRLPGLSIHQARMLVQLTQSGVQFHCIEDIAAALSLPVQRLLPLAAVVRFCYYDPESVGTIQPMNPNTATVEMLLRIPIVSPALAQAIVRHRAHSPYRSVSQLQQRLSLPGHIVAELMHYLIFS